MLARSSASSRWPTGRRPRCTPYATGWPRSLRPRTKGVGRLRWLSDVPPAKSAYGRGMPTAIVTGASRGLGHALAASLARDGWRLVVDGRDGAALIAALAPLGSTVDAVPGDIADEAHRQALVEAA